MRVLWIALGATFFHQILLSSSQVIPAVLAPLIIADLHVTPAIAGFYFGLLHLLRERRPKQVL